MKWLLRVLYFGVASLLAYIGFIAFIFALVDTVGVPMQEHRPDLKVGLTAVAVLFACVSGFVMMIILMFRRTGP